MITTSLHKPLNNELFELKKGLLAKIQNNDLKEMQKIGPFKINYHGIFLEIYTTKEEVLDFITSFAPHSWYELVEKNKQFLKINFYSPKDFDVDVNYFEDEELPDCFDLEIDGAIYMIQRDFAILFESEFEISVIINENLSDGFYNTLRWLFPRRLLKFDKILLHSSCIVNKHGEAIFFLGYSGHGKSTVAEFAKDYIVLGDDMNIIIKKNNKYYAEGAALGGLVDNKTVLGKTFPIKAFYWLNKAKEFNVDKLDKANASRKFISSCANIFSGKRDLEIERQIMDISYDVVSKISFYNLYFSLNKGFIEYVAQ